MSLFKQRQMLGFLQGDNVISPLKIFCGDWCRKTSEFFGGSYFLFLQFLNG